MADINIEVGAKPAQSLIQLQKDIAAIESSLAKTFTLKLDVDAKAFERKIDGITDKLTALIGSKGAGLTANLFANPSVDSTLRGLDKVTAKATRASNSVAKISDGLTNQNTARIKQALNSEMGLSAADAEKIASYVSTSNVQIKSVEATVERIKGSEEELVALRVRGTDELGKSLNYLITYDKKTGEIQRSSLKAKQEFEKSTSATKSNDKVTLKQLIDLSTQANNLLKKPGAEQTNSFENLKSSAESLTKIIADATAQTIGLGDAVSGVDAATFDGFRKSVADVKNELSGSAGISIGEARELATLTKELSLDSRIGDEARKNLDDISKGLTDELTKLIANGAKITDLFPNLDIGKISEIKDIIKSVSSTDFSIGSKAHNSMLSQAQTLRATIERNAGNWTAAKNGRSKSDYENYIAQGKEAENLINGLKAGLITEDEAAQKLEDIRKSAEGSSSAIKAVGENTNSLSGRIKGLINNFKSLITTAKVVSSIIRFTKEMVSNVVAIDTAMTELRKVTNETEKSYDDFLDRASERSKNLGMSLKDTINATADFARLGYDVKQAEELADAAIVYKNVGEGIKDISSASESIISTMQAFGILPEEAMSIVDKFNEVGNNFAISSEGIGEALMRSASSMKSAGNTLDETIALITAGNTIVQNPEKMGTTLKTVSMYLRAAKTEAEEAGESTDGMATSVSKLREEILSLTKNKVDIQLDANNYKSTYQIFKELSMVWDDLTDITKANILEKIGGKRNSNVTSAIIENFSIAEKVLDTSMNSAGSALAENEKVVNSIQGKINILKSSIESLSTTVISGGLIKGLLDGGAGIIQFLDEVIDRIGLLPALMGAAAGALSITGTNPLASIIANGTGGAKLNIDPFGLKNDVAAIKEYNNAIAAAQQAGKDLSKDSKALGKIIGDSMDGASNNALQFVTALGGAQAPIEGLTGKLIAQKVATVGLNVATSLLTGALAALAGVAISAVFSAISDLIRADEIAIQKGEEAASKIKEMSRAYKDVSKTVKDSGGNFAELSQHVDQFTGKNIDLSTEEYQEYLNISNELAETFPSLSRIYDENGNAIVGLNGDVQSITSSLEELLAVERDLARQKIGGSLKDLYEGTKIKHNDNLNILSNYENILSGLKDTNSLFTKTTPEDIANIANPYNSMSLEDIAAGLSGSGIPTYMLTDEQIEAFKYLFERANLPVITSFGKFVIDPGNPFNIIPTIFNEASYTGVLSSLKDAAEAMTGEVNKKISEVNITDKNLWRDFAQNLSLYFSTDDSFLTLDDTSKAIAQKFIGGLDYGTLNNGKSYENAEDVRKYIIDHIITPLRSQSPEVKAAFAELFSIPTSGLGKRDAMRRINELAQGIAEATKNAFGNASELLDKLGFSDILKQYADDIKNSPVTKEIEKIKQNFSDMYTSKGGRGGERKNFDNWIDSLSDRDQDIIYTISLNTDTAKWTLDDWKSSLEEIKGDSAMLEDALRKVQVAKDAASGVINIDVSGTVERLETLQSALQSSQSATGMLGDSISAIRSAYGSLDSYDESTLFEKTANGIHLNTTELQKLEKEAQNIDGKYIDAYLDNLIDKYKSLSEQMADIGSFTPEYTNLSLQRDGILSQIRDLELLQAQYAGATSAYKQWVDAQSGGEEGDMYDSTRSGFSRLDELRKQRLVGTNEFRAGVQALSYEDMSDRSDGEVMTWYDQNREKLSRYFAEGSAGLKNMAADLAKINSEWVKFDENGNVLGWTVDVEEAAKALGISAEMIQAAEKKASDYGYKVNLSSSFSDDVKRRLEEAGYGADSLSDKLQQANEKLQELGRTSINFDFNTRDESKLDLEIKAAQELVDGFRDLDGNVDVSVEGATEAQNILMQLLIAKRSVAEEPAILKVKTDSAEAEGALQDIKELASFINTYDWESIKIAAGVDAENAKAKIDEEFAKIKENPPEILAKLGIDASNLESSEDLRNALQQVSENSLIQVGVDPKELDSFLAEEHNAEGSFHWINDDSEVDAFKAAIHTATGTITWKNKTTDPVTGVETSNLSDEDGTAQADGTAITKGASYANGNWGTEGNGDSLVGELGTELVVRDGRYFTVGENGAEMFHYKKGDIIFNAEQTKQILEKGKISSGRTRGKAFDSGTADSFVIPSNSVIQPNSVHEAKRIEVDADNVVVNTDEATQEETPRPADANESTTPFPNSTSKEELDKIKSDFDAYIKDVEHKIFLMERNGASDEEIIAEYNNLKTEIHTKANDFRAKGEGEESDYIQDLQKQWWEYDDTINKINEENLDDAKNVFESAITELKNKIALTEEWLNKADKIGDTEGIKKHTDDIVGYYDEMQKKVHAEANRYRNLGYDENSEEIKELQKQWWEYENSKLETTSSYYERITAIHENSIKQNELFLKKAIENGDIETQKGLRNKLINEYNEMQKEAHDEAEYYRSLGYAETSEEITEAKAKWWEYENAKKAVIQTYDESRKKFQNSSAMLEIHIDKAISDKDFDTASSLIDELTELYTQIQDSLHEQAEAYREAGLSEDSDEISALSSQWWEYEDKKAELSEKVKNNINELLNDKLSKLRANIERTTEALQEQSDAYDILIDKQNALADAQERRNDSLRQIRRIESDIAKELRANKALSEYLDEDTRKLLFNEDDYNKLNSKLSQIASDIGGINEWYAEQINSLTADNWYLEESITNEYERRLKAKESEYEIARAELDLEKKKLELNNILNERNIRMLVKNKNGEYEWQYVHDVNKVSDIMGEISDLENEISETRLQTEEQSQVDAMRTRAELLKNEKSAIDTRISLINKEVENFAKAIEDITSPLEDFGSILEEINRYTQGKLSGNISSLSEVTSSSVNGATSRNASSGSNGNSSTKATYNPKIDYSLAISEAEKMGDYEHAKLMEKKRNAKIDGEGLNYEKTYKYNPEDDPKNSYDDGGIARGKGYLFKDTDSDELVLNPIQTEKASRFAELLENCDLSRIAVSSLFKGFKAPSLALAGASGDTYNFGNIILPEVREPRDFMTELKKSLEHNAYKK